MTTTVTDIFPYEINGVTFHNQQEVDEYTEKLTADLKAVKTGIKERKQKVPGPRKVRENLLNEMVVYLNGNDELLEHLNSNLTADARLTMTFSKESGFFVAHTTRESSGTGNHVGTKGFPVVINDVQYDSKSDAIKQLMGVEKPPRKKVEQESMLTGAGYDFTEVKPT